MKNDIRFVHESHDLLSNREEQRDAVYQAARRHLPHVVAWISPQGNAPLWVTLPLEIDPQELLRLSEQEGVIFTPGPVASDERSTANPPFLAFGAQRDRRGHQAPGKTHRQIHGLCLSDEWNALVSLGGAVSWMLEVGS